MTLHDAAALTDLYELTMAAAFFRRGMTQQATFSLFVRHLPPDRGFLIAAGLEDVLAYLESFKFAGRALEYLRSKALFDNAFLDHLAGLRFTGSVRAVPEGSAAFPNEPLLEITAPMLEAQLVETAVLNIVHLQTLLASKAARVVQAARGRQLVEFGLRRAHGIDAGMKAARCAYLAGVSMTSNVLAGIEYGIPTTGTMAHSFVSAFPDEGDAFSAFAEAFPGHSILLIDTYDVARGAARAIELASDMAGRGERLKAVRIDSGDLDAESRAVRRQLDDAGLSDVHILVSGGLDEHRIAALVRADAPIDAFGVGTRMDVSADAPYLDVAYKLVRYGGRDVLKLSAGKHTWPGEKQVFRFRRGARFTHDLLALREEVPPDGAEPLLIEVMRDGASFGRPSSLEDARIRCAAQIEALPPAVTSLEQPATYRVEATPDLAAKREHIATQVMA